MKARRRRVRGVIVVVVVVDVDVAVVMDVASLAGEKTTRKSGRFYC